MRSSILRCVLSTTLGSVALAASAVPITYTLTTRATGAWDGVDFSGARVTLSLTSDTSLVTSTGGVYRNAGSARVAVEGYGSATVDGLGVYASNGEVGFARGGDVFFGVGEANGYDLRSSLAPLNNGIPVARYGTRTTSSGTVTFVSASDTTFSAQAVPEPASMAALGLGVAAMLRRRKKA